MARSQTLKKKGRSSGSAKRPKGRKAAGRTAGRARRPTARGMAGSKGKGRHAERQGGGAADADAGGRRSWTGQDTGVKPEGSLPPTLVSGDATVAEQRRAASRPSDGDRASTRGPEPRGGQEGRDARARRAGLGFRDED